MGFLIQFAFRNLRRHRRRTWITASAVAVGLAVFLFLDSMLQGADRQTEHNLIWYTYGGAQVMTPASMAPEKRTSLSLSLPRVDELLAQLKTWGQTATPRLGFQAQLTVVGPENRSEVIKAVAIDAQTDPAVFPRKDIQIQGRWFGSGESAVVLGLWLAQDLNVHVGQSLSLTCRTLEGSFQVIDLEVSGIIDTPDPSLNRRGLYLDLALAQQELTMANRATEIVLALPPGQEVRAWASQLQRRLQQAAYPVRVFTWQDLAGDYLALSTTKQKSSSMILFLVFVIAAVGVGNTFLLAFYERKTEIGMLRALGMPDRSLFWTFITEAAGIGLLGSVMGLILGGLGVAFLVFVGIDFSFLIRQMDIGYHISGIFYGTWVPTSFVGAFFLGIGLSALSAMGPTRRALRLAITESLRAE